MIHEESQLSGDVLDFPKDVFQFQGGVRMFDATLFLRGVGCKGDVEGPTIP